jgi:hypothetical protein
VAEDYRCLLLSSGMESNEAQNENVVRQGVGTEKGRELLQTKT